MKIVRRWDERVGTDCMVKLFSVGGVAGRIVKREWEARLELLCEKMGNFFVSSY
jgi:hypothetical protein